MSSRYMQYLRKNQKKVMVVMCIVCMFTFVVGAALLDLVTRLQQRSQDRNPVAVTWTRGAVHERELETFRFRHIKSVQFLAEVIAAAIQRGGKPMVNGRQITQEQFQTGNIDVGISQDSSDASLMQTMVLAEEAKRMGVAVDLDAVKEFLKQISAPELVEGDWLEIAKDTIGSQGGMTVQQLLEHVGIELKAQHVRMLAMSGLYGQGAGPIIPPGEAWNYFNRLNRRLGIEAYPVEVEPLISQVKTEPTTAELQKLFDEGKFEYPNPNMDEPGFRKPHKLAFTYLKVNFQPYLEAAKKQITDEQVKSEYEKDVAAGRHKVQEIKGLAPQGLPPQGSAPQGLAPQGLAPQEEKKEGEAKEGEKGAEKPAEEKPAEKPEEGCHDEQPAATEKAAEAKVDDKPAAGKAEETKPADVKSEADKPAEAKAEDAKPAETKQPEAKPPETKVKPLEEVAEEIRTRLAQPIAEEARKKDVAEVTSAIEKYGERFRRFENIKAIKKEAQASDPGKLDIEGLAAKFNFEVGKTELADQFEIAKTEIGKNVEQFDMQAARMGQFRMMSFAELAYSDDEPLYRAHEVRSNENDIFYVYFRTAEEKPADITLADVRKEVVAFWKRQKAFELAKADAEKLAEKARGAMSLRDVVADPARIIAPPPFSWMTTGSIGFGRPEYSRPAGIELAGRDFMQAVFAMQPGETGVAPNNAHRIVYVVRVISQEPDDEKLQQQFLESGYNQLVMMVAQSETMYTSAQWWQGIEEKYQVKWQRPPRVPGMERM
jgi:hypothetical protein